MAEVTFAHHTAAVNNVQLHYVTAGQGDPVVLLHGWPETWYQWRKIIPPSGSALHRYRARYARPGRLVQTADRL